jgi:hypothetical protein
MLDIYCRNFGKCSAPFCPLERYTRKKDDPRIWFPDEEICTKREVNKITLVKQQRKIKKKAKDRETYYTREMLEVNCTVNSSMTGIDSNKARKPQVIAWKMKHPPISKRKLNANVKNSPFAKQASVCSPPNTST